MASSHRLPQELIRPATPRRVAVHVLGTLAVLVTMNFAAWAYTRREPLSHDAAMAHAKWDLLRAPAGDVDTLIVGDSSGNFGVMPELLEEQTGWKAINVCTMGRYLAVGDVWMVQDWIDRNGPPARVISVHAARRWEDELEPQSIAQVPLPFGFWKHSPDLKLDWGETRDLLMARYVPLYASSVSLSRALRTWTWRLKNPIPVAARGHASLADANPTNVQRGTGRTRNKISKHLQLEMTEHNRTALETLRDLSAQHGFELYLAHGPVYEGLVQAPGYQQHLWQLNDQLSELVDTSEHVHLVFTEPPAFPIDQMENPNHLVGPYPAGYTSALADALTAASDQ